MKVTYIIIAIALPVGIMLSCKSDKVAPENPDCPTEISFSSQVQPMIQTNCSTSGCHATPGPGKPALNTHAEISANASQIRNVINKNPGEPQFMPLGGQKLADSLLQQFGCWIDQGLQDN
ncbi:MAG: hypothetical protein ACFHU9_16450 [Fluviicola sp.]|jgi:hypothetical protein